MGAMLSHSQQTVLVGGYRRGPGRGLALRLRVGGPARACAPGGLLTGRRRGATLFDVAPAARRLVFFVRALIISVADVDRAVEERRGPAGGPRRWLGAAAPPARAVLGAARVRRVVLRLAELLGAPLARRAAPT